MGGHFFQGGVFALSAQTSSFVTGEDSEEGEFGEHSIEFRVTGYELRVTSF